MFFPSHIDDILTNLLYQYPLIARGSLAKKGREEEELVFRGCALISRRPVVQTRACKRKICKMKGEWGRWI